MAEENKTEQSVEMISFGIIANAGDARSFAFQALEAAKEGKFDEADELMKKSDEAATLAHNVLLVHSQDHLMTSMLAQELIKEMIIMYKNGGKTE